MPDTVPITTEWRLRKTSFASCIAQGCPRLDECAANQAIVACPIGDAAWANANPVDRELVGHNTVLYTLLNKVRDMLAGVANSVDLDAERISVGTGTAVTVLSQTQLGAEVYRDTFVDRQRPSAGKISFYWFFGTTVANGALREWGILDGNATASLGDGNLLNRWLATIDKTSADTVSGQYSITFA
jgi:hypothetical protein